MKDVFFLKDDENFFGIDEAIPLDKPVKPCYIPEKLSLNQ